MMSLLQNDMKIILKSIDLLVENGFYVGQIASSSENSSFLFHGLRDTTIVVL